MGQNTVKQIREKLLMSKTELAKKAGISPLTISRIEKGMTCLMETKSLKSRSQLEGSEFNSMLRLSKQWGPSPWA